MAVFLLKAKHGQFYLPPDCSGVFDDVTCPSQFADWIEQLVVEGITVGCGGNNYCPSNAVTRAQMAVFLLKAKDGSAYLPLMHGRLRRRGLPRVRQLDRRARHPADHGRLRGNNYCPTRTTAARWRSS
jgi:hypothetical protein